jgi:putative membrane protein
MKHRFLILIAALALVAALGCKKNESYENTSTSTTNTTYTDTSATTTTTGTMSTTGTETTGTGGTASTLSEDDKDFAMKVAQGNMAEVSLGSMAAQKGTSPDVKTFGNRMVNDHGKALDELKQLATNKGITLPTDVSAEQKATADKLSKYSGKQFDKAYADTMADEHEKDAKTVEKASKDAKDPDLKAWAAKTLPVIQDHLKMAKEMKDKVKNEPNKKAVSG